MTEEADVYTVNCGMIGGHAFVRAANARGQTALFVCHGQGQGEHCYNAARAAALSAGFTPLSPGGSTDRATDTAREEAVLVIGALKTRAIELDRRADKAQFANERCAAAAERDAVVALAKRLAEQADLPLHNGAEEFSRLT